MINCRKRNQNYYLTSLSPAENSDFIVNSNQITFPILDFDTDRRCSQVSMTILDDLAVEANETVKFVLESEDPERVVVVTNGGAQQAKVLTIVDNDGESGHVERVYSVFRLVKHDNSLSMHSVCWNWQTSSFLIMISLLISKWTALLNYILSTTKIRFHYDVTVPLTGP